jgi:hypothetical protein
MLYLKNIFSFVIIWFLNLSVFVLSTTINTEQFLFDVQKLQLENFITQNNALIFLGFAVTLTSFLLVLFFTPFIEIYIQHYFRYSFYVLINLLSISTIFITFRIYGYSRFYLLLYLVLSSLVFYLNDKNYFLRKVLQFYKKIIQTNV